MPPSVLKRLPLFKKKKHRSVLTPSTCDILVSLLQLEADSDGYKPFYRNSPYATCITPLSRPTKMQVPTRDAGRSRCTRFFPKRPAPPAPAPVEEEVPTEGEDAHEESE